MAFTIPASSTRVVEVIVQGTAAEQTVINRWHTQITNGDTSAMPSADIMSHIKTLWQQAAVKGLHNTYTARWYILKLILSSVSVNNKWSFTYAKQALAEGGGNDDKGAKGGSSLPISAAMTIQLKGDDLGKSRKGGKRFAPLVELDTKQDQGNYWEDATVTTWQSYADGMFAPFTFQNNLQTSTPCIASPKLLNGGDATDQGLLGQWTTPITFRLANKRLGSQNSRKSRRDSF